MIQTYTYQQPQIRKSLKPLKSVKDRADYCPLWRNCVPIVNRNKICKEFIIYAYNNYYWIENTLKFLKPFKLCLYVKQNSQGSHSPKLSLVIMKVGPTLTSSPTPFPTSYRSGNSFYLFSAVSSFSGACLCENRPLPRLLAGWNLRVARKYMYFHARVGSGSLFVPGLTKRCRVVCSSQGLFCTFRIC